MVIFAVFLLMMVVVFVLSGCFIVSVKDLGEQLKEDEEQIEYLRKWSMEHRKSEEYERSKQA